MRRSDAPRRESIRAVLVELLPLDDRRREEAIVLGAVRRSDDRARW
ncbi:hypothetical protein ABZ894_31420 [Nocardia beijingensis]